MPTFIARSGSFNNLKLTGLSSSIQTNIVSVDTASGQLYYAPASSAGLTITNNQNGNLLTATGGTTIRGSVFLNIKDLNSGPTYTSATQAVLTLAPETAIVSSGSQFKWANNPGAGWVEGLMTSSAYKIVFGRGLVTYEASSNVATGTNVPALYLGNYNDTSSFTSYLAYGNHPVLVIGSGTSNTNRSNALVVSDSGEITAGVLNITTQFQSNAPVIFTNALQVNGLINNAGGISSSNATFTRASGSFTGSFTGDGSGLTNVQLPTPPANGYYTYRNTALNQYNIPTVDQNGQLTNSSINTDSNGNLLVSVLGVGTVSSPLDLIQIDSFNSSYGMTINNGRMQLSPLDPLPSGQLGSIAVSGSSLWFHNGSTWKEVNLL